MTFPCPAIRNHAAFALLALIGIQRFEMPLIARIRRSGKMTALARTRRCLQKISPYLSLVMLLVPLLTVEPLKLLALIVAGKGHWFTGTGMILGAYALSLLVVERLFRVVKPKLMTISWFSKLWTWFTAIRDMTWARLRPANVKKQVQNVHGA
jgi:formate-dependent nitrite reductase membrane component NrfD